MLAVCVVLLLLATIPPLINLGRFQRRIAGAISRSVGRPVGMGSLSLRLLPWPAFQIQNLVVGEDPAFGAEPALRAPEVVIEPRLSSLWRGRFELSRVELSDASVNLVRAEDGRWNISSVLLQASHVQNAPTGQTHAGAAPRFPYIQATATRINFKRGVEKLPYSLLNADFSMWLAQPTVWQLRLEGQPVRTDLELSLGDTGLLRLEGELHRASAFGTMPLRLQGEWSHAPLGQLSRLLLGRDAGWRGDIDATAAFDGEMNHLDIHSHLVVANLHRQEFTPEQPLTLDATCQSVYSHSQPALDATACRWPLGTGALRLVHAAQAPAGAVSLFADALPAGILVQALALVGPSAPGAQSITGALTGRFDWDPALRQLSGSAAVPLLSVVAEPTGPPALSLQNVVMRVSAGNLLLASSPVAMGIAATPMQLSAELSPHGYTLHANGAASVAALQAAAAALRLPGPEHLSAAPIAHLPAPVSGVQLALTGTGAWLAGSPPDSAPDTAPGSATGSATGTIHLQNVQWQPAWLPSPVTLPSADAALTPGTIRWSVPVALFGDAVQPIRLSGNTLVPLGCAPQAVCPVQFALSAPLLDAGSLQHALAGHQPLLTALLSRMNTRDMSRIRLPAVAGSLHAGLLTLGRLPLHDASLVLSTVPAPGSREANTPPAAKVLIESLDGRALGGNLHLQGDLTFTGSGPLYTLQAVVTGASVAEAGALWHENWGTGTLGGSATFSLAGSTPADLIGGIAGDFTASWTEGGLVRSALPVQLLHFSDWDAAGKLAPSGIGLEHGTLDGSAARLTGTIGWDRGLDLTYAPAAEAAPLAIRGTLAAPSAAGAPGRGTF